MTELNSNQTVRYQFPMHCSRCPSVLGHTKDDLDMAVDILCPYCLITERRNG